MPRAGAGSAARKARRTPESSGRGGRMRCMLTSFRQPVALAPVAGPAAGDQILPRALPPARPGDDVVERQVTHALAAVLAGLVVAQQNVGARGPQRHARDTHVRQQLDDDRLIGAEAPRLDALLDNLRARCGSTKVTFCLESSTTRRRSGMTESGWSEALSTSTGIGDSLLLPQTHGTRHCGRGQETRTRAQSTRQAASAISAFSARSLLHQVRGERAGRVRARRTQKTRPCTAGSNRYTLSRVPVPRPHGVFLVA